MSGKKISLSPTWEKVVELSALLDISEFNIFADAYRNWHTHQGTEANLEYLFGRLLNEYDPVPHWLTMYVERFYA